MLLFRKIIFSGSSLLVGLLALVVTQGIEAQNKTKAQSSYAQIEVFVEHSTIGYKTDFHLLIRQTMAKNWHTYWVNPGDSGEAITVRARLSEGLKALPLEFPLPQKISVESLMTYGYEGVIDYILPIKNIINEESLPASKKVTIALKLKWLECDEICLPAKANLELSLPIAEQAIPSSQAEQVAIARSKIPPPGNIAFSAVADENYIALQWPKQSLPINGANNVYFFAYNNELVEHFHEQVVGEPGLVIKRNINGSLPQKLQGVFSYVDQQNVQQAMLVDTDLKKVGNVQSSSSTYDILWYLLLALAGGLLLNIMPCVLPVLSLKALSLADNRGNQREARQDALFYALGIVVSFSVLSTLLAILRLSGLAIGWGFQLQSPYFIAFFAMALTIFALNLLGVFETGLGLSRLGAKIEGASHKQANHKNIRAFFSGVAITLLATPCSAPFMGSAIGFALGQSIFIQFAIFIFLGLGLALPFLVMAVFEKSTRFIPKAGPWLLNVKIVLGFILMATVVWLLWIFYQLTQNSSIISILTAMLIVSFAAWLYGQHANIAQSAKKRIAFTLLAFVLLTVSLYIAGSSIATNISKDQSKGLGQKTETQNTGPWQNFSADLLQKLLSEKKAVFIDFTADWCLSCKVNKLVTLDKPKTLQLFSEKNVELLMADWTHYDPAITQAINGYGRQAIPLYVYYPPGKAFKILPEIITYDTLERALE